MAMAAWQYARRLNGRQLAPDKAAWPDRRAVSATAAQLARTFIALMERLAASNASLSEH
jgi:hypothetical protein